MTHPKPTKTSRHETSLTDQDKILVNTLVKNQNFLYSTEVPLSQYIQKLDDRNVNINKYTKIYVNIEKKKKIVDTDSVVN